MPDTIAPTPAIYMDYAAATPLDPRVLSAMQPYLTDVFYNPSALYSGAQAARQALQEARASVARTLGSRPSEVIFTAGGTEANNLAIHGVMRRYSAANIVVSSIEHSAVLKPAARYDCLQAQANDQGIVTADSIAAAVTDETVLISCMYANNEIGTVQPVRAIAKLCEKINNDRRRAGNDLPIFFHVDACQAPNYLDVQVSRIGADLISLNGSKIYGPKQSGVLFVKSGVVLEPLIDGGGQERGLRSGTENLAGAAGFAKALELAAEMRRDESQRLKMLQQHWYEQLAGKIPQVVINGSKSHRLPNNIHLSLPGADNERLLFALDDAGVAAAAGSACSASSQTPSTVLTALGLDDATARSSIRFTMGRATTVGEVDTAIGCLKAAIDANTDR